MPVVTGRGRRMSVWRRLSPASSSQSGGGRATIRTRRGANARGRGRIVALEASRQESTGTMATIDSLLSMYSDSVVLRKIRLRVW